MVHPETGHIVDCPSKSLRGGACTCPAEKDAEPPVPVRQGDVFATFIHEATSLGNEVVARREQGVFFREYLAERNLTADFEAWSAAKTAVRPSSRGVPA